MSEIGQQLQAIHGTVSKLIQECKTKTAENFKLQKIIESNNDEVLKVRRIQENLNVACQHLAVLRKESNDKDLEIADLTVKISDLERKLREAEANKDLSIKDVEANYVLTLQETSKGYKDELLSLRNEYTTALKDHKEALDAKDEMMAEIQFDLKTKLVRTEEELASKKQEMTSLSSAFDIESQKFSEMRSIFQTKIQKLEEENRRLKSGKRVAHIQPFSQRSSQEMEMKSPSPKKQKKVSFEENMAHYLMSPSVPKKTMSHGIPSLSSVFSKAPQTPSATSSFKSIMKRHTLMRNSGDSTPFLWSVGESAQKKFRQ